MMHIENRETGGYDQPTVELDGCPKCGLCADCRRELIDEAARDRAISAKLGRNEYIRGVLMGVTTTALVAMLALTFLSVFQTNVPRLTF